MEENEKPKEKKRKKKWGYKKSILVIGAGAATFWFLRNLSRSAGLFDSFNPFRFLEEEEQDENLPVEPSDDETEEP